LGNPTKAFALKMFMSRMTLYRKMKAITGDSPSAFIRSIRMNKAAALLATKEHNVSETADLVGLPDLSSFSTAFKKHFNVSPSQYTRRHDTTD
jgi:AraC-like DNA-binding protein